MTRLLSMPFGINCNNKWLELFFTGLTLAIYSLFLINITVLIKLSDTISVLMLKLSCSITVGSKLASFVVLKYKSVKIFGLYDRLLDYQIKSFITTNESYFSSVISILCAFVITVIGEAVYFCDLHFTDKIYKELTVKQEYLPINQKIQIFIISFYVNGWFIFIQSIYYEFNTLYTTFIEAFIEEFKRKLTKPDRNVLILTQRTVLKFCEFKFDLKKNINFIKYFLIIDMSSTSMIMIYALFNIPNYNIHINFFSIVYLFIMIVHFLWVRNSSIRVTLK